MRRLRVSLLSPAAPPGINGITDYVVQLASALTGLGVDAAPLPVECWAIGELRALRRELAQRRPDVVHLQHPIVFPGRSYVPQILANLNPGVVTTHGGSQYGGFWGKVSLGPFMLRTRHLVFTSEFERDHALRWAPWMRARSSVVPIGSNIPGRPAAAREPGLVVTFGLVRPGKGLEAFLAMARAAAGARTGWRFQIIGNAPASDGGYAANLRAASASLPIEWLDGLDSEGAAEALGRAELAVLPFPDGASERRGTLLACMAAGTPVLTRRGPQTPRSLDGSVAFARDAANLLDDASALMSDFGARVQLSQAGATYAKRFTWEAIAQRHLAIYNKLAGRPAAR